MSVALVTLEETKLALRIDGDDYDDAIEVLIAAASEAVADYLKVSTDDLVDSGGDAIEARVKWATIVLVGYYLRNPDADPDEEFERGYLPKPITALLYPMRDPTLA